MKRIITESGAVYLYDDYRGQVMRADGSPYSGGINYDVRPDGVWHVLAAAPHIEVGWSVEMDFVDGDTYRVTTPVVSVEEAEEA